MRPCCGCYAYMMVSNQVISDDSSTIEPGSLAMRQYAATARIDPFVHHLSRQRDECSARDSLVDKYYNLSYQKTIIIIIFRARSAT